MAQSLSVKDINTAIGKLWPSDNAQSRAVSQLKPFDKNSRTHSEAQIRQIEKSIAEWGWTMPILIDENNTVLAGHARLAAAKNLGISHVPCIVADSWSEAQKRAYVIADNKLAENGGWDDALLASEFADLAELGFEQSAGLTDEDDVPDAPAEPRSKLGDMWLLGRHRVRCGDSTQKPVECMRRPIVNNSKPGDAIYDPFLGSGTTLIAAESEGRVCYGMELNPAYVDVIVKRWEDFTGQEATLAESACP